MKKILSVIIALVLFATPAIAIETLEGNDITISAPSAILLEKESGAIIYEKNPHERLSPASVTKVMTILLVVEEIERGNLSIDDLVSTSANARSMGGSQIWLEDGEKMSVHDMLKAVVVVSANDCAVALAEHISGTEESFVAKMNERAIELGMVNTEFSNCTGLFENEHHLTTAYDIALMSRELIKHDFIKEYTTIWMDSLRDGEFGLSNTNKLIYYFSGATGLKTGYTSTAMYCLAATAERDGVEYIAVIMKSDSSNNRFESAKTLLNYAFANYTLVSVLPEDGLGNVPIKLGKTDIVTLTTEGNQNILMKRSEAAELEYVVELPEYVDAPISAGTQIGLLTVTSPLGIVAEIPLLASNQVERIKSWQVFTSLLHALF